MGREEETQLKAAKRGYREASAEGNREEEARWANVIGDMLKQRGEYVEALRWLRIDYDVSVKFLPQKQLLPTCQSVGEVYFRLDRFEEALVYQKKHLELAKESNDLIEQQRSNTQLGRTYHEIFLRSEDDHCAVRNAKKYFKSAMKIARTLKDNSASYKYSPFLKEFIDAHNNIGMLEMDLDNLEEAERFLLEGLRICNEEEVVENDDGRSRLHHNLCGVYLELRQWAKSREHIEKDILICKRIGHPQGEAKGFINLGELQYRIQKYTEAVNCYQKALDIARSMEDEDALVDQITQNIKIVKEAVQVQEEIKIEEQKLKKLSRTTCNARGTAHERRYLLEQNASLDRLIEKTRIIFAWKKHLEFAKRKKRVVNELCDKEKLSDSYLAIGESYQKLRNFSKARNWYMKSWNIYRSIGNLEGQALAKINIGEVLDSCGDWAGALEAFEEGYRIAVQGKLLSVQLSALNNLHYSHMIRFDNDEDARKLQHEIQNLKHLLNEEDELKNLGNEYCSETETEGLDMSGILSSEYDAPDMHNIDTSRSTKTNDIEGLDEDVPLASLVRSFRKKNSSKQKKSYLNSCCKQPGISCNPAEVSSVDLNKSPSYQTVGRKRIRVVISDDEIDEYQNLDGERGKLHGVEGVATSDGDSQSNGGPPSLANAMKEAVGSDALRDVLSTCTPIDLEGCTCSSKSRIPEASAERSMEFESLVEAEDADRPKSMGSESRMDGHQASGSLQKKQSDHNLTFKVGTDLIHLDKFSCMDGEKLNTECLKVKIACLYYLQLTKEKTSKGLLPVFQKLKVNGKELGLSEAIEYLNNAIFSNHWMEVIIDEWAPKRLMKLYIDCCKTKSEEPNMTLLKKLYNLEVSEDEIIISDCGLQDVSISPFVDALHEHKTVALLDVSHNTLGNETMEKLKQVFTSSTQTYGSLILDFHCNRFGPTSLFQICECPVLFTRLEVLNLSDNRLTDACSSYLSTILINCRALYSLSIEQCSITSRTIQKITDVLEEGHALSQLKIGKNSPISGSTMVNLLVKLTKLTSFSELGLNGLKLNKNTIDSLCQLASSSSMSNLMLGSTNIGADGALQVTKALSNGPQELVKLDLSDCGLRRDFTEICANIELMDGLLELNLGINSFEKESCSALSSLLLNPQCSLRVLILNKCQLGLTGILHIIKALEENESLEELHAANNVGVVQEATLLDDPALRDASKSLNQPDPCAVNFDYGNMEVADSEDELTNPEHASSALGGSRVSSSCKIPFTGSAIVQELSAAVSLARRLLLLDLSGNRLSEEMVETLYTAWSLRSSAQKHVEEWTVHFSVEGKRCCGTKSCCRRDGSA